MSKWTCPECGGTWDAIEMNKVGKKIWDIIEDVKICSRCCQMKLAEARIAELESESRGLRDALKLREEENEQAHDRIAELEATWWQCESCGARYPSGGEWDQGVTRCTKCVENEMLRLREEEKQRIANEAQSALFRAGVRIAELEALQQWHPASEPPEWINETCKHCGYARLWNNGAELFCRRNTFGDDRTNQFSFGVLDADDPACPSFVRRDLPPTPERIK